MKSNESKPLGWETQKALCWKYFKAKTWYWEILWDKVWIIRGLVFGAALSNFLFAAQTSNCFGCFCHPATSAHNNPHCPQQDPPPLLFVFDTVLLQIVLAPPLNSFVSAHSLINVLQRPQLFCRCNSIFSSWRWNGQFSSKFFCPTKSSPSGCLVKPSSREVKNMC